MKHMKSKYLNQSYENWKVISAVRTRGGHKSFILAKRASEKTLLMTLRDSQLSKVAHFQTSMQELIEGKIYQLAKNIRITQNTISAL